MEKVVTVQGAGPSPGQRDYGRNRAENPSFSSSALTLKVTDVGKTLFLDNSGSTATATLPAAADAGLGWNVDLVVKGVGGNYTVSENSSSSSALVLATNVAGSKGTSFEIEADTALNLGDRYSVDCDGTYFYVQNKTKAATKRAAEEITADKTLAAQDSGKIFYIDAAAATSAVQATFPPAADAGLGWEAEFIVKSAPTGSGDYVLSESTSSDTNVLVVNGINELEVDTAEDGPYNAGCTTVTFATSVAVAGDYAHVKCDGTNFYVTGQTKADGGITLA